MLAGRAFVWLSGSSTVVLGSAAERKSWGMAPAVPKLTSSFGVLRVASGVRAKSS